ncbi:MAG: hypothetical protein ACLTDR_12405 [Adlercreutzia equolifaciens]
MPGIASELCRSHSLPSICAGHGAAGDRRCHRPLHEAPLSTVLDCAAGPPRPARAGALTLDDLKGLLSLSDDAAATAGRTESSPSTPLARRGRVRAVLCGCRCPWVAPMCGLWRAGARQAALQAACGVVQLIHGAAETASAVTTASPASSPTRATSSSAGHDHIGHGRPAAGSAPGTAA